MKRFFMRFWSNPAHAAQSFLGVSVADKRAIYEQALRGAQEDQEKVLEKYATRAL